MKKTFTLVSLFTIGALSAQEAEYNIILNPDFEVGWSAIGAPNGWDGEGIEQDTAEKASGEKSAKIYADARTETILSQYNVPVKPNTIYTLSYKALDKTSRTNISSNIIWLNDAVISRANGKPSVDDDNWQTITEDFTSPAEVTKAILRFRVPKHGGGNTDEVFINIDDVVMIKKGDALSTVDAEKLRNEVQLSGTSVKDAFTISVKGQALVDLINMNGQKIRSQQVNGQHTFEVSSLPKGVYMVSVNKDGNMISKKIVVR